MQPVFWHRVPCTSQWGAWHAAPDCGLLFGPEIWDPKSSLPRGGAIAFLMPREPKQVKLLHSNPDFISHQEATVP